MTLIRKKENPVIQIMKKCGMLRPIYLLFLPAWLTVCIVNAVQSLVLGNSIDFVVTNGMSQAIQMATICVLCTIIAYLFSIFNRYLINHCVERQIKELRIHIGQHLVDVPYVEMESMQRGDVLSRTMGDLENIQVFLEHSISSFTVTAMGALIGITISMYTGWKMTTAVLAVIPVIMLINVITTKSLEHLMMVQKEESGRGNGIAMNYLQQLSSIKAFNLELLLSGNYFAQLKRIEKSEDQIAYKKAALSFVQCLSSTFVYITMIGTGALCVLHHELTPGKFVVILMLMQPIGAFAYDIQAFLNSYKECKTGARRILELLNLPKEAAGQSEKERKTHRNKIDRMGHFIEFDQVSFSYQFHKEKETCEHKVLNQVSFHIDKGQKIAVVGSSGCGKSTLIKLLCGLYEPTEGKITLDGILYNEENIERIREKIAVVLQENYLFPMTIADNIRCGRPEASMEEVIEAAKKAGIDDFIQSLPDGYLTELTEEGMNVSGGQRQRICIARAYIKKPEVLILDEPTAALDTEMERIVQRSIDQLMEGKTTITVAHRLSTIIHSDLIFCMENGQIAECGTHEELYARKGRYYHLYQIQEEMAESA